MTERSQQEMIAAEAVEHHLRLLEPGDPARRAAEFSEWLTRSPAHVEAFLNVVATWHALDVPDSTQTLIDAARAEPAPDNVVELPRPMPVLPVMRRSSRLHFWGLAAAVVLTIGGWLGYSHFEASHVLRNASQEVRQVRLPDGSLIDLNPNSEIYLRWTAAERRLDLRQGRARFQVAKNPQRPFLVDTQFGTVRAVGTIFDVDAQRRETRVTVIEGRVAVESAHDRRQGAAPGRLVAKPGAHAEAAGSTLQLSAGDRAKIIGDDAAGSNDITPGVVAWTDRRVVFRGATLDTVVDEFNRYQSRPIIISDARLAPLIISGVFDPKNPDSLLSYLELYEGVKVQRMEDGSVLASLRN